MKTISILMLAASLVGCATKPLPTCDSPERRPVNQPTKNASSITPTEVYDDGSFTYLRFAPRADMPAVYYVNEDRIEKLATFNVKDDVLVVHRVAPTLVLRRGDSLVACIYNEAYDPVGAKRPTNTKSPAVERVIKGAE